MKIFIISEQRLPGEISRPISWREAVDIFEIVPYYYLRDGEMVVDKSEIVRILAGKIGNFAAIAD
ncbi:hypothetical protein Tco_1453966, partial [Tanacetum coccineum]